MKSEIERTAGKNFLNLAFQNTNERQIGGGGEGGHTMSNFYWIYLLTFYLPFQLKMRC